MFPKRPHGVSSGAHLQARLANPHVTLHIVPHSKGCLIFLTLKSRFTRTPHCFHESAVDQKGPAKEPRSPFQALAPFAIGTAVFVVHVAIIPVDGVSINPARSFGPAVVLGGNDTIWDDMVRPQRQNELCLLEYCSNQSLNFTATYKRPITFDRGFESCKTRTSRSYRFSAIFLCGQGLNREAIFIT